VDVSRTQITSPTFMICVADFRDLCPRQSPQTLSPTLSPTFPMHCNGLNSIRATQTGLSRICHGLCRKHLDMSRWFVSATFTETSWFHDLSPFASTTFPAGKFRWKSVKWNLGLSIRLNSKFITILHRSIESKTRQASTSRANSNTCALDNYAHMESTQFTLLLN